VLPTSLTAINNVQLIIQFCVPYNLSFVVIDDANFAYAYCLQKLISVKQAVLPVETYLKPSLNRIGLIAPIVPLAVRIIARKGAEALIFGKSSSAYLCCKQSLLCIKPY
jgi:hypothetical protein